MFTHSTLQLLQKVEKLLYRAYFPPVRKLIKIGCTLPDQLVLRVAEAGQWPDSSSKLYFSCKVLQVSPISVLILPQ